MDQAGTNHHSITNNQFHFNITLHIHYIVCHSLFIQLAKLPLAGMTQVSHAFLQSDDQMMMLTLFTFISKYPQ